MAAGNSIPQVDFKDVLTSRDLSQCGKIQELHSAFSNVGFVFIKNHGIENELIDEAFSVAMDFFNLPLHVKKQYLQHIGKEEAELGGYVAMEQEKSIYSRTSVAVGYTAMEQENVDITEPADLKEAFQIVSVEKGLFPDKEVPNLKGVLLKLFESGIKLSCIILELMGHALKLEDPLYFVKSHQKAGHSGNFSTVRLLHYPPLPSRELMKPGQHRCGEHVDYGSITLLFQDPDGGLQVNRRDGGYIDVPYVPGAVLVNLGALMQNWTADQYIATPHRVLNPGEESKWKTKRQSIVVFMHPDYETVIRCIDGSEKYPAITAFEDTNRRLNKTHVKSVS